MHNISSRVWSQLRCVECGAPLRPVETGAQCSACGASYSYNQNGSLDLRLRQPRPYPIEFSIANTAPTEQSFTSKPLRVATTPQVDFSGIRLPRHLNRALLSHFPKAPAPESLMLDLGCGEAVHKEVCEHAGYEWVGMDYQARSAPILADAQSIPFADGTFDFILCVTVLQYVQNPFVAVREMLRVLKPGGTLMGSVAFLEPSHGTSFFHPSHVGTYSLLEDSGFTVQHIGPFADWPVLKALASMGLFFRMPRALAQAIVAPLQLLHVLWWRLGSLISGRDLETDRLNHFAGSISFIATKPG